MIMMDYGAVRSLEVMGAFQCRIGRIPKNQKRWFKQARMMGDTTT